MFTFYIIERCITNIRGRPWTTSIVHRTVNRIMDNWCFWGNITLTMYGANERQS